MLTFIIVPFIFFGESLDTWSTAVLDKLSEHQVLSAVLIVAILASDVVLPVPSSVVSTLSGVLLGVAWGTIASFAGMTMGCVVGYGLGRTAGKGVADRLVGAREVQRLEEGTRRHGDWSVVAARAVPVLAEASTLFAGMGSMRFGRFLLLTSLSNLGISLVYASVGAFAAEIQSFLLAVAGAVSVPLVVGVLLRKRPLTGRKGSPPRR